ncbi:bifunctional methylenetetrahydrofolate dehydrogenase/methenyltetrahydrofolate cyclohydrolase FolD [Rhodothermus marinus]|uniref:bifunctional methylenetetrahydrofolate dehydrogenase/methenyltetrahydrofolate cyclohydrolase FolD n=1 Tax=Rhodothermus marinus TaxID=29549 RepID=UPI0012BA3BCC|nr:bifunctional methylenetetrahydrofolate dehydrogenase/methenyltetrahydrofolate cyclohydrolase FolD [Rhodothermus marinus]BBM69149.1 bifunctional protein FolD [Rhodothermus marinus]BBM72142.1 bifunctional protein FolD [Rhodothermus marinus]
MTQIIDGKAIAAQVRAEVKAEVEAWVQAGHRPPYLAVILVGDNPASASYVRGKTKAAAEVGIASDTLHFDTSISEAELLAEIARLNDDEGVDGILVQLPLPDHIDPSRVLNAIRPDKDVDGFHPINAGRLLLGEPGFVPATPAGILELLRRSGIETTGKHAVVVGRSNIVGRPLAALLLHRGIDATVTVCHSRTQNLAALTRTADILVAAIGRPCYITADMVREGAVVIDVGINRVDDPSHPRGYRLVGDVDFEAVAEKAGWITPVPGGVGPMTIALLLRNTLYAAQRRYAYA